MKPLSLLTVSSELPEALAPLRDLALNLRWTWRRQAADLFRSLDPHAFVESGENPLAMLSQVPAGRLAEAAHDEAFLARMRSEMGDLGTYVGSGRWFQRTVPGAQGHGEGSTIAYFSMEFGITPTLPIYSGGLGILAGDHLKSASDLGVPLVAVGLLYQWGYFSQSLDRSGWQQEEYRLNDPSQLPVEPVREADGEQLTVSVTLPGGREVTIAVWVATVGRVPLLLLDTNLEVNDEAGRAITDRLYGGDHEHRIVQEIVLGIGGVRAVEAFSALTGAPAPTVFHLNEGHAGFSGLERVGRLMQGGAGFAESVAQVRAGTVFTTHTPVPAGIDRFDASQLRGHLDADESGISRLIPSLPVEAALALGIEEGGDVFNMAQLGFRIAQRANGVARLHGAVSRGMFQDLYPGFDVPEVPIGSVTNGVHRRTWTSAHMDDLYKKALGDVDISSLQDWSALSTLTDHELTETRDALRADLVTMARRHVKESWLRRGADEAELAWTDHILDPRALTIGFARRVSTYKRLTLMLSDPERLRRILLDEERPVQIVVAGKSHPADRPGKEFLQQLVQFADDHGVRHRIAFLPDYDIRMASVLIAGSDVWLNNPIRPEEASGTSGMKAVLNGSLTFSVSDGWWDEMRDDEAGWTIPTAEVEDQGQRDRIEAEALYEILEQSIVPLFYERDARGMQRGWMTKVRSSLVKIAPRITAARMVRDYVTDLYLPAARAASAFTADPALAGEFTAWKETIQREWHAVAVRGAELEGADGGAVRTGAEITLRADVELGALRDTDVLVEAVLGEIGPGDEIIEPQLIPLQREEDGRWVARFALTAPGRVGCTVRVTPQHPVLASRAELGLVTTA
ncbi:alpha-glucan family phosphorylase [Brachybacterium saurashtrense]|uniref:glycogen phosphorylase n=1 Tax=Brachybacterium saurashtrense TaxID=556288 RepID=A0A345YLA0_9MICO|nr:alpha-glucan family phosphorylase [Brachybacterium saurashtrense]AXK44702.1 alpha-glucan family phosphorylase [Brachybacterium saurashtrense]RRR23314.1 alpha-glucan family phosphorylase [Brachybacterium saurashtrense]